MNQNGHYTTLASKPIFMRKGEKTNHINKKKQILGASSIEISPKDRIYLKHDK
jgi:hypothetical protein